MILMYCKGLRSWRRLVGSFQRWSRKERMELEEIGGLISKATVCNGYIYTRIYVYYIICCMVISGCMYITQLEPFGNSVK